MTICDFYSLNNLNTEQMMNKMEGINVKCMMKDVISGMP